jgi:hypothetical protein
MVLLLLMTVETVIALQFSDFEDDVNSLYGGAGARRAARSLRSSFVECQWLNDRQHRGFRLLRKVDIPPHL